MSIEDTLRNKRQAFLRTYVKQGPVGERAAETALDELLRLAAADGRFDAAHEVARVAGQAIEDALADWVDTQVQERSGGSGGEPTDTLSLGLRTLSVIPE